MKQDKIERTIAISKELHESENGHIVRVLVSGSLGRRGINFREATLKLTERDILDIWPNVALNVLCALLEKLTGRWIMVWHISGPRAITRVHILKGVETDPMDCVVGTWRRDLAVAIPPVRRVRLPRIGAVPAIRTVDNYIHCPNNLERAKIEVGRFARRFE